MALNVHQDIRFTCISGLQTSRILPAPTHSSFGCVNVELVDQMTDTYLRSTVGTHSMLRALEDSTTQHLKSSRVSSSRNCEGVLINGAGVLTIGRPGSTPGFGLLGVSAISHSKITECRICKGWTHYPRVPLN
jgi:hypothetical protein